MDEYGQVMIQPADLRILAGCFQVPLSRNLRPYLPVPNVVTYDGHPVPTEVAKTLDPRLLNVATVPYNVPSCYMLGR
jgi:hypothetical protein